MIGIARRAGRVAIGARAAKSEARRGTLAALVVADDAADNAVDRLGSLIDEVPFVRLGSRRELGRAVGRTEVAVLGITDAALAERILTARGAPEAGRDVDTGAGERSRRQVS